MKKLKLFLVGLATLAMAACAPGTPAAGEGGNADNYQIKIIAPKGAPSLAFYDMAASDDFQTAAGETIKGEFGQSNYGMVVMEFYTGLSAIKAMNSNYRLARVLTGGNLYLVSRSGKTTDPGENDKILAFGPGAYNGIPFLSLKALYPQIKKENTICLKSGDEISGALVSGTFSGKIGDKNVNIDDVDYVVIPQPALQVALGKLKGNETVKPNVIACLRDKAEEVSNGEQKWVLQAGLFIHKNLYSEHKAVFDAKLAQIDANIETIRTNPVEVKDAIETALPNPTDAKAKFSCPTGLIPTISQSEAHPNGFGFINASEWETIDVQSFLTFLGRTGEENDFSSYMLQR